MRYKELKESEKSFFTSFYTQYGVTHSEKSEFLQKKFGIAERTVRGWANKLGIYSNAVSNTTISKQLREASERQLPEDTDIVLVTAAQNHTKVNLDFLKSLKVYQKFLIDKGYKTEIVVIPAKYRNPTSLSEGSNKKSDDWWDTTVAPYLYYNKIGFGDTVISADSRIVPTATNPLIGYESLASSNNLILGHPRIHFKVLPRFRDQDLRSMSTTGFCTYKHYSRSKSGDKASIHHSYGFNIVEKKKNGKCFVPRCVKVSTDGSFTDIIYDVTPNGVTEVTSSKGIVLGDIHLAQIDAFKMDATMRLIHKINPSEVILHDVFDGYTINPHETKDAFIQKVKITEGNYLVTDEIDGVKEFLDGLVLNTDVNIKVVQSNHDDFIDQWVNKFDWKRDIHNSESYLKLALIQQTKDLRLCGNILGHLIGVWGYSYIRHSDSYFIGDYQVGYHGDHGINGAKGSVSSFKRLNQKMIHGHVHTPQIEDGVTSVGVSCKLWQYYNSKGLSSWGHADCIIHQSGKNQLIVYDNEYKISNLL